MSVCCLALCLVCGCGHSTEAGTDTRNVEATSISQSSPSTQPAESTPPPAEKILLHPTQRPPGVSTQFEFVGGAGPGACFGMGEPPQVRVLVMPFPVQDEWTSNGFNDKGIATYGQPVDVCFDGMGRGPISVTVNGPHNFTMTGVLPSLPERESYNGEWPSIDWVPAIEPSWPLGSYVISAHAGSVSRRHSLTVVAPQQPGLRVLGPSTDPGHNSVPPNSHATLFLTGFEGGRTVKLAIYRVNGFGPHARFFSAADVPIPPSGNTVIKVPTGPGKSSSGSETTFIITTRAGGKTLYAPFTVFNGEEFPDQVVGVLPRS